MQMYFCGQPYRPEVNDEPWFLVLPYGLPEQGFQLLSFESVLLVGVLELVDHFFRRRIGLDFARATVRVDPRPASSGLDNFALSALRLAGTGLPRQVNP